MQDLPNSGNGLADWHRRMPGSLVLDSESRSLIPLVSDVFGYHLLIVGSRDYLSVIGAVRVQHCTWLMTPAVPDPAPEAGATWPAARCSFVRGHVGAMPIASDSIDIVILPHVIEFEKDPCSALRESERVLVPEGHVIVAGYNALGPMGVRRLLHRRGVPWNGRFYTASRVRDWLSALGFDAVASEGCFFRPPISNARMLRYFQAFERVGPRFWPRLCGTWILVARKRIATATALRRFRRRRRNRIRQAGIAGSAMLGRGGFPADDAA